MATFATSERTKAARRFFGRRSVTIGLSMVGLVTFTAVLAPLLAPYGPAELNMTAILQSPSSEHLFGTDQYGRDLFSRVMYGARISLGVGAAVMALTSILGLVVGMLAGYYRTLDSILMRIMDMFMAFPAILLALGIIAILGPQLSNVVIALTIVFTPQAARVVRGTVLEIREKEFIESARVIGSGDARILIKHALPNCQGPLIVQETVIFAYAVLAEASLSFLGAGVQPHMSSWGIILSDGRRYLETAPWVTLFAGIAISLTVLGVNLLGDGLRDFFDPRMRT